MALKAGDQAPAFDLPTDGGGRVRLADFRGRPLVLYFDPKDDTSGCTTEALDVAATRPAFQDPGVALVGISKDDVASHDRFKAKHALPFALASDETGAVVGAYGSWVEKSMYGRSYMGIDRSTFPIDGTGTVREVWRKVKVPGHVAAAPAAAKGLT